MVCRANQTRTTGQTRCLLIFCIEKDPVARQIAMHMNPKTEYLPGITFPFDDGEQFTEDWLLQLPRGSVKLVLYAAPCVDFSKLRLLRNYAGKIPDPKVARPGLDGKHGALTRLSIQQWHMIQERHSPVMISENVPFQDMEDQWAEVETGWGVPAYVHNSATLHREKPSVGTQ